MHSAPVAEASSPPDVSASPPRWLIWSTAAFTALILVMAVAETTLWTHFLIDQGEAVCLGGLAFSVATGFVLYRSGRLRVSLPLFLPWLLYPIVTQGDQIIDNLDIDQMRIFVHTILVILFVAPVAVAVVAARAAAKPKAASGLTKRRFWSLLIPGMRLMERGHRKLGTAFLVLSLLLVELWVALEFLGRIMVLALLAMTLAYLWWIARSDAILLEAKPASPRGRRLEGMALAALVAATALSLGLYLAVKHRPGAYQGSPHYYHDPSRQDAFYPVDQIAVPSGSVAAPSGESRVEVGQILTAYGEALRSLLAGYYILDRNYNYAFHNALFLRDTPVLPEFRARGLARVQEGRMLAAGADGRLRRLAPSLSPAVPLGTFLQEIESYVGFCFRRADVLERMSAEFQNSQAGLQHATHLYEGEGKVLGETLMRLLEKHRATLEAPGLAETVAPFVNASREIHAAYSKRIVGF